MAQKSLLRQAIETEEMRRVHPEELKRWVRGTMEADRRRVFLYCLLIAAGLFAVGTLGVVVLLNF